MNLDFSKIVNLIRPIINLIERLLKEHFIDNIPLFSILLTLFFLQIYIRTTLHLPGNTSSIGTNTFKLFRSKSGKGE